MQDKDKNTVPKIRRFFKGLGLSSMQYKPGMEVSQILKRYTIRKAEIAKRQKQVNTFVHICYKV